MSVFNLYLCYQHIFPPPSATLWSPVARKVPPRSSPGLGDRAGRGSELLASRFYWFDGYKRDRKAMESSKSDGDI